MEVTPHMRRPRYRRSTLKSARELRRSMTPPERLLWSQLRDRRYQDLKFRRQVPIDQYIADFVCVEKKLVVELDGDSHALTEEYDSERTRVIRSHGYQVVRFTNSDVVTNMDGVLSKLTEICQRK